MKRQNSLLMVIILAVALILTGCGNAGGKEEKLTKIKVSEVTHSIFYAPQYVALTQGFFGEEGLDIELFNGGGADKVMTAVLTDQVEIGFAGPEATIYVYNEGKEDNAIVFAQLTNGDGTFSLAERQIRILNGAISKARPLLAAEKVVCQK